MSLVGLIVGIVLIIFTISMVIVSVSKTPDNLRGFYGAMFWLISLGGILGGLYLVVAYFIA